MRTCFRALRSKLLQPARIRAETPSSRRFLASVMLYIILAPWVHKNDNEKCSFDVHIKLSSYILQTARNVHLLTESSQPDDKVRNILHKLITEQLHSVFKCLSTISLVIKNVQFSPMAKEMNSNNCLENVFSKKGIEEV